VSLRVNFFEPKDDLELGRELSSAILVVVFRARDTRNFQAESIRAGLFELFCFYSRKRLEK